MGHQVKRSNNIKTITKRWVFDSSIKNIKIDHITNWIVWSDPNWNFSEFKGEKPCEKN